LIRLSILAQGSIGGVADIAELNVIGTRRDNRAPSFSQNEQSIDLTAGEAGQLQVQATDPDANDKLVYSVRSGPAWLSITTDGLMTAIPSADMTGAYQAEILARDSANAEAVLTLQIKVSSLLIEKLDTPKTAVVLPVATERKRFTSRILPSRIKGGVGSLVFQKLDGPGWLVVEPDGMMDGQPEAGARGTYEATIGVSDSIGSFSRVKVAITVKPEPLPGLWKEAQISGSSGSAFTLSGGLKVEGNGALGRVEDKGSFVSQKLKGSGEMIVKVSELNGLSSNGRAGIMLRSSLKENASGVFIGFNGTKGIRFQARHTNGTLALGKSGTAKRNIRWLKLTRKGSTVNSYTSSNGKNWKLFASAKAKLPANPYIGLWTSSGKSSKGAAVFQSLKVRR
jgi:hypothetical protein